MTVYHTPGAPQFQMDTGLRLTLLKAGAFGEDTLSKNEGSLVDKPNFGSKLGGIGWECYYWSFSERFNSRNLQKIVENGKYGLSYRGVFGWERLKSTHFIKKCGVFGWQQRQSSKIWGHWVTAVLKIGGCGALHPRHLRNGSTPPHHTIVKHPFST